jgi:hypothetical protein
MPDYILRGEQGPGLATVTHLQPVGRLRRHRRALRCRGVRTLPGSTAQSSTSRIAVYLFGEFASDGHRCCVNGITRVLDSVERATFASRKSAKPRQRHPCPRSSPRWPDCGQAVLE